MFSFFETDKKLIDEAMDAFFTPSCQSEEEIIRFMRYSALGGKRIRGIFALEFAKMLGCSTDEAMPFAISVECVQSYSLIHDDLPCMDDDDMRRGKPSSHIAFGEANALLAGDALLTEAFYAASSNDFAKSHPERALKVIKILSEYAGYRGMVTGQVMDLEAAEEVVPPEKLSLIHELKTVALIKAAALVGCAAAGADDEICVLAEKYAESFGRAFQMIDDLLDFNGDYESCELNSYVRINGEAKTREDARCAITSAGAALEELCRLGYNCDAFYALLDFLVARMRSDLFI